MGEEDINPLDRSKMRDSMIVFDLEPKILDDICEESSAGKRKAEPRSEVMVKKTKL